MLFTSPKFVVLALITFALYYLPALRKGQILLLIVASLVFYGYNQFNLLWLLLLSVTINIVASYGVLHGPPAYQKSFATGGVVANLAILCFFKYGPLLTKTFLPTDAGVGAWLVTLPLPIGISFFTFQGISLMVDTYQNRANEGYRSLIARNLLKHAETVLFFKAFFPQLVAGPIVKAHDFLPQITSKYLRDVRWEYCFRTLVVGYFLKMVIADNVKEYTFSIAYPYFENISSLTLIALLFGYSIQIFADFAGYSLIALGLAGLFGYRFPVNFNFPYIATSFADFWRRWHISLSSFLREYLYIPLGGNRHGKARTYVNLLITMVLGGLWHGAAWSYAVWGLAHGLALAVERYMGDKGWLMTRSLVGRVLKGAWVFGYVTLAWLLFKLPDFDQAIAYLRAIGANGNKPHDSLTIMLIVVYALPVVAYHVYYLLGDRLPTVRRNWSRWEYAGYGFMQFMLLTNSGTEGTFIYFQF